MTAQDGGAAESQLTLASKLDLKGSEDLAKELQGLRGRNLTVDASAIEHLGAHAVQTLCVAARSWRSDGNAFSVANLSNAAASQLATMGMDQTIFDAERTD